MLRFFVKFLLPVVLLLGASGFFFSSPSQVSSHFQQTQKPNPYGDIIIASQKEFSTEEREAKWKQVQPFFQDLKKNFPGVLFVHLKLSDKKTTTEYRIHLLVENSDDVKIDSWSMWALHQLDALIANKVTLVNLENALKQAESGIPSQKDKYLTVFREHKGVLTKILGSSSFPYFSTSNISFKISEIAKQIVENQTPSQEKIDQEILAFLLAGVSPTDVSQTLALTSDYVRLWKKVQPLLAPLNIEDPKFAFFVKVAQNPEAGKPTSIIHLLQHRQETDYFELHGAAKFQLYQLRDLDFADFVKQLKEAYPELMQSSADKPNKSQPDKTKTSTVTIALATTGGVVGVTIIGGSLYWFLRIKK